MEWQAGYVSGALLMPKSRIELLVGAFRREHVPAAALEPESIEGRVLIGRVSEGFAVSREAAAVRLLQLGHLSS